MCEYKMDWLHLKFFLSFFISVCFLLSFTSCTVDMGLNHTAAMLSPDEGLKTFVFPHQNSFPNISTQGSGYEIYMYM